MSDESDDIEEVVQMMRTLTLAQFRRQLERLKRYKPLTFHVLFEFFKDAKEQPK